MAGFVPVSLILTVATFVLGLAGSAVADGSAAPTVSADDLTYTMIAAANATGQWKLSWEFGRQSEPGVWHPVNCSTPVYNACFSMDKPWPLQPLKRGLQQYVRVNVTFKGGRGPNGALATYQGMTPTTWQPKMCFSSVAYQDRAWRKKNKAYPKLSQNCRWPMGNQAFPDVSLAEPNATGALTTSFLFAMDGEDQIPTATFFVMLQVKCGSTMCAFETTETSNPPNFFQTEVYNSITPALRGVVIAFSIISPVSYILFYLADTLYYRKTGKAIGWS